MDSRRVDEDSSGSTIEDTCPPYLIYGTKKVHNPLEEMWMNRVSLIETQYERHVIKLERSLLDNKATKREIDKKAQEISKLKAEMEQRGEEIKELIKSNSTLQNKLEEERTKESSLAGKLSKTEEIKAKVLKSLESERFEKMKKEKELVSLKTQLHRLERDKALLFNDISIRDKEMNRAQEQTTQLSRAKYELIKNLTETEQKRRIQAELNLNLVDEIGQLLEGVHCQEYELFKKRKEIDLMLENLKEKRKEHEGTLQKLGITREELRDAKQREKIVEEVVHHLKREKHYWKEEYRGLEGKKSEDSVEIKELRRENSRLRCQLAEIQEKLNQTGKQLKVLGQEKTRTERELEKLEKQAKSLRILTVRNELVKHKLAEKILKRYPHVQKALEERTGGVKASKPQTRKEVTSYQKRIWELERDKKDLERRTDALTRRQDRLQFQLRNFDGMEKEVLWTEKAMIRLEGEKVRLEDLVRKMAISVPKKIPFKNLVTDPSILDRVSMHQVLQKRLMKQAEKVEALKRNAAVILEQRRLKEEDRVTDKRLNLSPWRLGQGKNMMGSEDTLADVDQHLLEENDPVPLAEGPLGPVDRKYYREYLTYLNSTIPQLKVRIEEEERKRQEDERLALEQAEEEKRLKAIQEEERRRKRRQKRQEDSDVEGLDSDALDEGSSVGDVSKTEGGEEQETIDEGKKTIHKTKTLSTESKEGIEID